MDKGNKDSLFRNILFGISFFVLYGQYIRVIRKKDNTRNVIYIQMNLMTLQCNFNKYNRYVPCCSMGGFSCARDVFAMVITLGRERKTVFNYELPNYEGS